MEFKAVSERRGAVFKLLPILVLAVFIIFNMLGCWAPDISAYGDYEINVTGLLEEDFTITPNQLSEMECEEVTATGDSAKAGTITGYGPSLETFLANYGMTLDDIHSMKCLCSDDYKVTLTSNTWDKYPVILSISTGDEAYGEHDLPMRIVVPGGDSGKWCRMVTTLQFVTEEAYQAG